MARRHPRRPRRAGLPRPHRARRRLRQRRRPHPTGGRGAPGGVRPPARRRRPGSPKPPTRRCTPSRARRSCSSATTTSCSTPTRCACSWRRRTDRTPASSGPKLVRGRQPRGPARRRAARSTASARPTPASSPASSTRSSTTACVTSSTSRAPPCSCASTCSTELGGFDPATFPGAEDLDLCWRARLGGRRVLVAPDARRRAPRGCRRAHDSDRPDQIALARSRVRVVLTSYSFGTLLWLVPVGIVVVVRRGAGRSSHRPPAPGGRGRRVVVEQPAPLPAAARRRAGGHRTAARSTTATCASSRSAPAPGSACGSRTTSTPTAGCALDRRRRSQRGRLRVRRCAQPPPRSRSWCSSCSCCSAPASLVTHGVPAIGTFGEWPGVGELFDAFGSAWRYTGLGLASAAPASLALMGGDGHGAARGGRPRPHARRGRWRSRSARSARTASGTGSSACGARRSPPGSRTDEPGAAQRDQRGPARPPGAVRAAAVRPRHGAADRRRRRHPRGAGRCGTGRRPPAARAIPAPRGPCCGPRRLVPRRPRRRSCSPRSALVLAIPIAGGTKLAAPRVRARGRERASWAPCCCSRGRSRTCTIGVDRRRSGSRSGPTSTLADVLRFHTGPAGCRLGDVGLARRGRGAAVHRHRSVASPGPRGAGCSRWSGGPRCGCRPGSSPTSPCRARGRAHARRARARASRIGVGVSVLVDGIRHVPASGGANRPRSSAASRSLLPAARVHRRHVQRPLARARARTGARRSRSPSRSAAEASSGCCGSATRRCCRSIRWCSTTAPATRSRATGPATSPSSGARPSTPPTSSSTAPSSSQRPGSPTASVGCSRPMGVRYVVVPSTQGTGGGAVAPCPGLAADGARRRSSTSRGCGPPRARALREPRVDPACGVGHRGRRRTTSPSARTTRSRGAAAPTCQARARDGIGAGAPGTVLWGEAYDERVGRRPAPAATLRHVETFGWANGYRARPGRARRRSTFDAQWQRWAMLGGALGTVVVRRRGGGGARASACSRSHARAARAAARRERRATSRSPRPRSSTRTTFWWERV